MTKQLIEEHFPATDFHIQSISVEAHLGSHFQKVLGSKAGVDPLADHLLAGADFIVMHKKRDPVEGTYFVRCFEDVIALSERDMQTYRSWYPCERFLLLNGRGEHCWLADFLEGREPRSGTINH